MAAGDSPKLDPSISTVPTRPAPQRSEREWRQLQQALKSAHAEIAVLTQRLHDVADRDPLTGLAHRRRFDAALADAQDLLDDGVPCVVGLLDLDHFKTINDRFGHDVGDAVLAEAAARLGTALRHDDLLARLGGEEFGIVFARSSLEQARLAAEKMRAIVSARPFAFGTADIWVAASIGLAPLLPSREPLQSLRRADLALFEAKKAGRDQVVAERPIEGDMVPPSRPAAPRGAATDSAANSAAIDDDRGLSAQQLHDKYQDAGDEHPGFRRDAWTRATAAKQTVDDYWGWVEYQLDLAGDAPAAGAAD